MLVTIYIEFIFSSKMNWIYRKCWCPDTINPGQCLRFFLSGLRDCS